MPLQPVEATLIAASVGAIASTSAVVVTHLLTRRRDRTHRIWDRRADAYVEVIRSARTLASGRREVLRTRQLPTGSLDPGSDQRTLLLTEAQLDLFGSEEVKRLHQERLECFRKYVNALRVWRDIKSLPPTEGHNLEEEWKLVEWTVKEWDRADDALVEAVRQEARFRRSGRRWFSRR
ncbi:hypothetical protein [Streptomyces venezuelae]|uniref:hypothetical protein n=1 Tax=Streptomyces venezuelae TaxID=54571 RepID=UPI0036686DE5